MQKIIKGINVMQKIIKGIVFLIIFCTVAHSEKYHDINHLSQQSELSTGEVLNLFSTDEYLIKRAKNSVKFCFLKSLLLLKEEKKAEAEKIIRKDLFLLSVKSNKGYYSIASKLLSGKSYKRGTLDQLIKGVSEVSIILNFENVPLEGKKIKLTNIDTKEQFIVFSFRKKDDMGRQCAPSIVPTGIYNISVTHAGSQFNCGKIKAQPWHKVVKEVSLIRDQEFNFRKTFENGVVKTTKPVFEWNYKLKRNECFLVEVARVNTENKAVRFIVWGPYETSSTKVTFGENGKNFKKLSNGKYEFNVYIMSKGEENKRLRRRGNLLKFEVRLDTKKTENE